MNHFMRPPVWSWPLNMALLQPRHGCLNMPQAQRWRSSALTGCRRTKEFLHRACPPCCTTIFASLHLTTCIWLRWPGSLPAHQKIQNEFTGLPASMWPCPSGTITARTLHSPWISSACGMCRLLTTFARARGPTDGTRLSINGQAQSPTRSDLLAFAGQLRLSAHIAKDAIDAALSAAEAFKARAISLGAMKTPAGRMAKKIQLAGAGLQIRYSGSMSSAGQPIPD